MQVFEDKFGKRRARLNQPREAVKSTDWRKYGEETPSSKKRREEDRAENAIIATEALDAVQSIIGALTHPEGGRFVATFNEAIGGGITNGRSVQVTSKPLFDPRLRLADACTVIAGLAVHEVGHIHLGGQAKRIAEKHWPGSQTMQTVANVLDDVRIDVRTRQRFPGMAPTIRPVRRYMAVNADWAEDTVRFSEDMDLSARLNFAIRSLFYAPYLKWVGNTATRAERTWWQAWGERFGVALTDEEVLAGLITALQRITPPPPPPEPEPEDSDGDDGEPSPDDDTDDPTEDSEPEDGEDGGEQEIDEDASPLDPETPEDAPEADDEPEPTDEADEGEDGQDGAENEPEDDPDDDAEADDESGDGIADEDTDEGESDDEPGTSDEDGDDLGEDGWDEDDDGDEAEDESQGDEQQSSTEMKDEAGDGSDLTDVDLDNVPDAPETEAEVDVPSIDDYNQPTDEDKDLAERVKQERQVERVTMGDGFGTMRIEIE